MYKKTLNIEKYNFKHEEENYKNYYLFRYLPSIERLVSFLEEGVFMTRADKFTDNLECVTYDNLLEINKRKDYVRLLPKHNPHITNKELENLITKANGELNSLATKIELQQKKYHISCWYLSQHENENELMWRSYGSDIKKNGYGFLVRINLQDFMNHLKNIELDNHEISNLVFGSVSYFDFNKGKSIQKVKYTGFRKHISFKDESEFRLICYNNTGDPIEKIFINFPRNFYSDIRILAHPNYNLQEFHNIRRRLESHYEIDIELSELYIWYKLRENLS